MTYAVLEAREIVSKAFGPEVPPLVLFWCPVCGASHLSPGPLYPACRGTHHPAFCQSADPVHDVAPRFFGLVAGPKLRVRPELLGAFPQTLDPADIPDAFWEAVRKPFSDPKI